MQKLRLPIDDFKPTAGYKNARYRRYWGYTHYGVDCVSAVKKRTLYGLGDGVVIAAGLDGLNGRTTGKGSGCGYCLVILYKDCYNRKTGEGVDVVCTYMHMAEIPKVKAGDKVTTKTLLGHYGNTGAATTGPHLHIQFDSDTRYPMYCTGLSSKGHALLKRGSVDSTIDPVYLLNIGKGQRVYAGHSFWYDAYSFEFLPNAEEAPKPKREKFDSGDKSHIMIRAGD